MIKAIRNGKIRFEKQIREGPHMIRITQLKLPVSHRGEDLEKKAAKILRVGTDAIKLVDQQGNPA